MYTVYEIICCQFPLHNEWSELFLNKFDINILVYLCCYVHIIDHQSPNLIKAVVCSSMQNDWLKSCSNLTKIMWHISVHCIKLFSTICPPGLCEIRSKKKKKLQHSSYIFGCNWCHTLNFWDELIVTEIWHQNGYFFFLLIN